MKNWIIRLLLTIIILIGLTLGALNLLGGNGPSHKNGLESAFDGALRGQTTIDKLNTFNIFPQTTIDLEGLITANALGLGDVEAKKVVFSFNFLDLLLKRRKIRSLDITDLTIDKGIFTDQPFTASSIKIEPKTKGSEAYLSIIGNYGETAMEFKINMNQTGSNVSKTFSFAPENKFAMTLGDIRVTGLFTPNSSENTALQNLTVEKDGQSCDNLPEKNRFTIQSFTSAIFSDLYRVETNENSFQETCKDIMRYSL